MQHSLFQQCFADRINAFPKPKQKHPRQSTNAVDLTVCDLWHASSKGFATARQKGSNDLLKASLWLKENSPQRKASPSSPEPCLYAFTVTLHGVTRSVVPTWCDRVFTFSFRNRAPTTVTSRVGFRFGKYRTGQLQHQAGVEET